MEKKGGEKGVKIAFWNVIGMRNKDKDFWAGLKRWDANVDGDMGGEEEMELYKKKIIKYVWRMQVKKRNKKGRAMRGLVIGIKRGLYERKEGKKEMMI